MRTQTVMAAVLVAGLAMPGAAQAQSISEKTGVNSVLGISPSSADFVKKVAVSDMFEIESSKLAQQRADTKSKVFAEQMIKDHSATSSELKAIAAKSNIEIPAALDSSHQKRLDKLKELQGSDFDREYDSAQLDAHKAAVDLFSRYGKRGDNAELKSFASKHLPHLRQHLRMARDLSVAPRANAR